MSEVLGEPGMTYFVREEIILPFLVEGKFP
jgi:hypothetical protein